MLDFEENRRILANLDKKLKEIGESLWHNKIKKRARRIRTKNQ